MEDRRDAFVVMAAGYPGPMEEFLSSNPGFPSRCARTLQFRDCDVDELLHIFRGLLKASELTIADGVVAALAAHFLMRMQDNSLPFLNGRPKCGVACCRMTCPNPPACRAEACRGHPARGAR